MLSSMECVCGFEEKEVEHIQTQEEIDWGEECLCRSGGCVCLYGRKCVCIQTVPDSLSICMCSKTQACSEYVQVSNCVCRVNQNQTH